MIRPRIANIALILCLALPTAALAEAEKPAAQPSPREQVLALQQQCEDHASAMAERQTESSLYERLGKEEGIHALTKEIVRLHRKNEALTSIMEGVDDDVLAKRVAEFIISGTGGPQVYHGRDMKAAHAHLELTNADFMSAGGDVIQAMKNKDCSEGAIEEMVCTLVSLRPLVVIDSEKDLAE